jgi:hypothetical protein
MGRVGSFAGHHIAICKKPRLGAAFLPGVAPSEVAVKEFQVPASETPTIARFPKFIPLHRPAGFEHLR